MVSIKFLLVAVIFIIYSNLVLSHDSNDDSESLKYCTKEGRGGDPGCIKGVAQSKCFSCCNHYGKIAKCTSEIDCVCE